jgi:hypothetical protein
LIASIAYLVAMSRSVKQTRLSPFSFSPPAARFEEPPKASGVSPLKSVTTNLWWMTCPAPPLHSCLKGSGTCFER